MRLAQTGSPWADLQERFRDIHDFFRFDPKAAKLIIETVGEDDHRRIAARYSTSTTRSVGAVQRKKEPVRTTRVARTRLLRARPRFPRQNGAG